MLGTIVNTATIIAGTIAGAILHAGIKEKYKRVLYDGLGLASLAIGLNATITNFPKSDYPVLFIISIAVGGVVGIRLDIDGNFRRLVERRRQKKDGCPPDSSSSVPCDNRLADGLSTAILLYCIGPLSMLGPVISALKGDNTFLFTNATLDLVTSTVFASTYGIGMILAAPVLFLWQGSIYLFAGSLESFISPEFMTELSIVGGFLIAASGISILKIKEFKTMNLLPSLLVPIAFFLIKSLFFQ